MACCAVLARRIAVPRSPTQRSSKATLIANKACGGIIAPFPRRMHDHSDHRVGLARWHFGCLSTSAPIHHPATWGSSEVGVPKTKTGAAPHRSGVDVHSLAPSPHHPERSEGSALGLFRVLHSRSFVAALLRMTGKDLHRRPADAISERRRSPRRFLCGVLPRHGRPRGFELGAGDVLGGSVRHRRFRTDRLPC